MTRLAGAALLGKAFTAAFGRQRSHVAIGVGAGLRTIMLANVWPLIRPAPNNALGIVPASDAEKNAARYRAFLFSRVNRALVFATIFFMAAGAHSTLYFRM